MRRAPLGALALGLITGASMTAQGDAPIESIPEAQTLRTGSWEEVDRSLEDLAQRAGEFGRLETLALLSDGREVRALTLTRAGTEAVDVPALLFLNTSLDVGLDETGAPTPDWGARAVLALGEHLVAHLHQSPVVELLADRAVILLPVLEDPAQAREGDVHLQLNFPFGWRPASIRPGSGRYPLAHPGAYALATWLEAQSRIGLVVTVQDPVAGATDEPWPGARCPASDREVLRSLCAELASPGGAVLRPWSQLGSVGGGPLDYAYQALGMYPLAWSNPEPPSSSQGADAWLAAVVSGTQELVGRLPRVTLVEEAREELAPGLWQLDLAIRNTGHLPTLSTLAAERSHGAELRLSVEGAELMATARRSSPSEAHRVVRFKDANYGSAVDGGILAGDETRGLLVVLEGVAEEPLTVTLRTARAGVARLVLSLQ